MRFDVSHSFHDEARHLAAIERQMAFAAAGAINDTLFQDLKPAATQAMQVFDRPTPFTLSSVRVDKATRDNLVGTVYIPTDNAGAGGALPAGKPLLAEVRGGPRRLKRSEKLLQAKGLMPRGMLAVPGPAATIDAYGNMVRSQILHLLSFFQAFGQVSRSGKRLMSNMTDEGRAKLKRGRGKFAGGFATEYFVIQPGSKGLRPGIYERKQATARRRYQGPAQRVRAVLFFVTSAQYKRLYDFHGANRQAAIAHFEQRFSARFGSAMASAREFA
jgi:hypothetical protein